MTFLIDTNTLLAGPKFLHERMARRIRELRLAARVIKCRWQLPDADGRCRFCGWPLIWVPEYMQTAGIVVGHYRHRRPRIVHMTSAQSSPYRQWPFDKRAGAGGRLTVFTHESWAEWQAKATAQTVKSPLRHNVENRQARP